jgi:predicted metal-dependent peptidase
VDTSGSISDEELSMFLAEIKGILKAVVSEVTVLSCDSVVHEKAKINRITQLKDKLVGGGGTNMAVGIQEALKEGDIVVVFTDGETPWPEEPVKKPVIAVLTQDNEVPGWIKKVVMD